MSVTNKVLYNIDQTQDPSIDDNDRARARKNIGAYEDKTTAGGIPKADLASDVQSSLGKADSSVQSVTSNGQALTKSAAGAIDIPKATNSKWGVVQVENTLSDNLNSVPTSRLLQSAVDELSAALQARATFWTVQEWQTQSAQPGDASKIYYVGPKGTGNDQYDMYEWRTSSRSYVLTDESTISLDGYWHGAPDIVGEDTVAPFITSIEKNADDTVKYRTCSATVGDLSLPVFMDSGVVTPADPHYMYPTVTESTSYEEVKRLVDAGYRPIFVPSMGSFGVHTRYILTGAVAKGYTPAFVFTTMTRDGGNTRYFSNESIGTVICQNAIDDEETWVWNTRILIPNIPEPNDSDRDVGKVLTVGQNGELYWDEGSDPLPTAGENQYLTSDANSAYLWRDIPDAEVVRAGTNNLHVSSASEPGKTIYSVSADYYQSRGYSTAYSGPGTVIIDSATMNIESTNSGFGYKETLVGTSIISASYNQTRWNDNNRSGSNIVDMSTQRYSFLCLHLLGQLRDDCVAEFWSNTSWCVKLNAEELRKEPMIAIPDDVDVVYVSRGSENLSGEGYAVTGYNLYGYKHSDNVGFSKGELAWKDETYNYVDEQVAQKEPLLPRRGVSGEDVGKLLTVSGRHGELGWMTHSELPETSGSQYLIGDNGTPKWRDREKLVYRSNSLGYHTVTQGDLDAGFIVFPITTWNIPAPGIAIDAFLYFLVVDEAGYTHIPDSTGHPLMGDVTTFSIGYWNDDNTWRGGLLEDIAGSDLPYGSYGHGSIRRTGVTTCTDSTHDLYKMRGPAIRLNFKSSPSVAVGDKIKIGGTIIGIRIDGGLW